MAEDDIDKGCPGSGRSAESPDGFKSVPSPVTQVDVEPIIIGLQVACENSETSTLFVKNINNCISILIDYQSEKYNKFLASLLSSGPFGQALDRLSAKTLVPEFTKRDYFSYDKSDFSGQCDVSLCVLEFFVKLISSVRFYKETLKASVEERRKIDSIGGNSDELHSVDVIGQKLSSHLPNLVLMVAGNASNPLWSSQACQELSLQFNQLLLDLYGCERIAEIFTLSVDCVENSSPKQTDKSLLTLLLHRFEIPLSRERWEKNPFLCEAFLWFVTQLNSPQLSACLNQVLAVALNFLHNFDVSQKLKGLQLIRHLIDNISNEELRWYNRAEVIYDALKTEIYSKETFVLDGVITCMFSLLQILEKPHDLRKKHHFILSTLLTSAESENLLSLRRIYISNLAKFMINCEAICIAHLQNILRVIKCYLEVDDGPDETARIGALDALQNVLKVTWPRIGLYSKTILKFLLRFIIDINSLSFVEMKGKDLKKMLEDKVIQCLILLNKLEPSVKTSLDALQGSNHYNYLDSLLTLWQNNA